MTRFAAEDFQRAIQKYLSDLADWWDRYFARRGIPKRAVAHDPSKDSMLEVWAICTGCGKVWKSRGNVRCKNCRRRRSYR